MTISSRPKSLLFTFLILVAIPSGAKANLTFITVPGSDSDGPLAATVTFALNGTTGIEITITNTESGTFAKGQAVSDLSFTLGGNLKATLFTELKGLSFRKRNLLTVAFGLFGARFGW